MIDKDSFIQNFTNQLLDTSYTIDLETYFRELDDWDSLTAMAVIVMLDDTYGLKVSDEQFLNLNTLGDIYNFINENRS
jgi:acyl carrier protein